MSEKIVRKKDFKKIISKNNINKTWLSSDRN